MDVTLVMFKADGSRRDFPVTKPRVVVGRTNDCDLRIPLSSVSRQHCEFRLENGQLKLRDLGSSNGTFRNNTRIMKETSLHPGDEVVIGPVVFTVLIDGLPVKIDPVRTVLDRNRDSVQHAGAQPQVDVEPQRVSFDTGSGMPSVEDESFSPTVHLDEAESASADNDDPIAALEALARGTAGSDDNALDLDELEDLQPSDEYDPFLPRGEQVDDVIPMLQEEDEDLPTLAEDDEIDLSK